MSYITKSPWIIHYDGSSCNGCDIEVLACLTPMYDVERFGDVETECHIFRFRSVEQLCNLHTRPVNLQVGRKSSIMSSTSHTTERVDGACNRLCYCRRLHHRGCSVVKINH